MSSSVIFVLFLFTIFLALIFAVSLLVLNALRVERRPAVYITRYGGNPIIAPRREHTWESGGAFNTAAVLIDNAVHLLYRAVGSDGISRFGYAASADGYKIDERLGHPVYEHKIESKPEFVYYSLASGGSWGGAEDPRIVRVADEDKLYMMYTACDDGLRVAITSIDRRNFVKKQWEWAPPKLISARGEVHKNWVLFPEKISGKYAILHSINPGIEIAYLDNLEFSQSEIILSHPPNGVRKNCWDNRVRGAGPPPIKTERGWLLLYHATEDRDPGKYKVGAMLLSLNDPARVLCRASMPVLAPEEQYENDWKPGIVYASGLVLKDGTLFMYYGGGDKYTALATAPLDEFLDELMEEGKVRSELFTW